MANQLIAPSSDSTAPVAPGKRDVANRSAKAAGSYSGVLSVGPGATYVDAACCPEKARVNASDDESGRLYQTPDLFSLTSPRDSAYGTARTVSIAPRGPEKLRTNTPKDEVEDMDETMAPSGTVDPSKVMDELDGAASFHIAENDAEVFPVSPHTQTKVSSLQRASVPHKSTVRKNTVTMESSGEEFSAYPDTHGRASPLHQNLPFRLVTQRARKRRTIRPCQDAWQKTKTVFHRRAPESWASPTLHAHTGEVRFTGPGLIPRRKPSYPTGRKIVLFTTKRLSRWKEATKAYQKATKEKPKENERRSHTGSSGQPGCSASSSGQPGCSGSPRTHD